VLMPDGNISYTRNGQFSLNEEGEMVTSGNGYTIEPAIQIPEDAMSVSISQEGEVTVTQPGNPDNVVVGQLNLVNFINPAGLQPM
ncbi:flagellar basal body rod protein FlgG, partial [Burkholderia sp. SIMBA_013]